MTWVYSVLVVQARVYVCVHLDGSDIICVFGLGGSLCRLAPGYALVWVFRAKSLFLALKLPCLRQLPGCVMMLLHSLFACKTL